jgi:hypothetical protein
MKRIFRFTFLLAMICVLALCAFALAGNRPSTPQDSGDVIIIKGGSIEIQCGRNHGNDCLGTPDASGRYKRGQADSKHIMQVVVKPLDGSRVLWTGDFDKNNQPRIEITYR